MKYNREHYSRVETSSTIVKHTYQFMLEKIKRGDNIKDCKQYLDFIIEDTNTLKEELFEKIED